MPLWNVHITPRIGGGAKRLLLYAFIRQPQSCAEVRALLPFDLEEADGIIVEDVALFLF